MTAIKGKKSELNIGVVDKCRFVAFDILKSRKIVFRL